MDGEVNIRTCIEIRGTPYALKFLWDRENLLHRQQRDSLVPLRKSNHHFFRFLPNPAFLASEERFSE